LSYGPKEARSVKYRFVIRGELGDKFAYLFEGMQLTRAAGMTVLTGAVVDQAHLHSLIAHTQNLGLELVSVKPVGGDLGLRSATDG
jgi:hypothetical protein